MYMKNCKDASEKNHRECKTLAKTFCSKASVFENGTVSYKVDDGHENLFEGFDTIEIHGFDWIKDFEIPDDIY